MSNITHDSPSVLAYLNSLQSVIARMASNSSSSKTWCITLISAIIVFASDKSKPDSIWIALVPISLFFLLDSYYLGLERQFRAIYNDFISKLHTGTISADELFVLTPNSSLKVTLLITTKAATSISTWPFYILTVLMLTLLRTWIF